MVVTVVVDLLLIALEHVADDTNLTHRERERERESERESERERARERSLEL